MIKADTSPVNQYDPAVMLRLPVDTEHLGIRIALPLLAFGALVLVWVGLPRLLEAVSLSLAPTAACLTFPLAVGAAIGAAYVGDRVLKRVWPTRRELLLDDRYLVLRRPGQPDRAIRRDLQMNILTWRFTVPRRGRIPKGHFCLGLQLAQDETHVTLYTFIAPKESETLEDFAAFTPLIPRKELDDPHTSLRVAGQQRRLFQAESERWNEGSELAVDDFKRVWAEVRRHEPAPTV